MSNIIQFPGDKPPEGGGPEDPMLEQRVAALEGKADRIEAAVQRLEVAAAKLDSLLSQLPKMADFASVKADAAETKGRLSALPSTWQLLLSVIATWASGAAIVFTILKFGVK